MNHNTARVKPIFLCKADTLPMTIQLCVISPNRDFLLQFIWGAVIRTAVVEWTFALAMSAEERAHVLPAFIK